MDWCSSEIINCPDIVLQFQMYFDYRTNGIALQPVWSGSKVEQRKNDVEYDDVWHQPFNHEARYIRFLWRMFMVWLLCSMTAYSIIALVSGPWYMYITVWLETSLLWWCSLELAEMLIQSFTFRNTHLAFYPWGEHSLPEHTRGRHHVWQFTDSPL